MSVAYRLANIVGPKQKPWRGEFVSIGDECFAGVDVDGSVVICWKDQNYVPMKPTLRVRMHNWLVTREMRLSRICICTSFRAMSAMCQSRVAAFVRLGRVRLHRCLRWTASWLT